MREACSLSLRPMGIEDGARPCFCRTHRAAAVQHDRRSSTYKERLRRDGGTLDAGSLGGRVVARPKSPQVTHPSPYLRTKDKSWRVPISPPLSSSSVHQSSSAIREEDMAPRITCVGTQAVRAPTAYSIPKYEHRRVARLQPLTTRCSGRLSRLRCRSCLVRRGLPGFRPGAASSLTLLENLVKPPPNSLCSPLYRAFDRLDFPSARPKTSPSWGASYGMAQPALSQVLGFSGPASLSKPPASAPARAHGLASRSCLSSSAISLSPGSPSWPRAAGSGQRAGSPAAGAVRWPQAQRRDAP